MQNSNNLIWLDLEMTGLNPEKDRIIEIATVVTDSELNILAEGPSLAIKQPDSMLDNMDEWCTNQHGASGLTQRVRESLIDEKTAEQQTLDFLAKWIGRGESPICGNTIYQDRRFLVRYMPRLESYFHYRNLDVSTLKILAQHWRPDLIDKLQKESRHLALEDVYDSIEELKHYRQKWLSNK